MNGDPRWRFQYHFVVTLVLLMGTVALSKVTVQRKSDPLTQSLDAIPLELGGFEGADTNPPPDNVLTQLKATSLISRSYRKPGLTAEVFVAFYAQQRAGENMHSPKHCLPGSGWEIWDYGSLGIPVANRRFTVNKYSINHDGDRRLMVYWYQSKEQIFASEYLGKILLARDALMHNSTAAAIVRVIVPDRAGVLEEVTPLISEMISRMGWCFGNQQPNS